MIAGRADVSLHEEERHQRHRRRGAECQGAHGALLPAGGGAAQDVPDGGWQGGGGRGYLTK